MQFVIHPKTLAILGNDVSVIYLAWVMLLGSTMVAFFIFRDKVLRIKVENPPTSSWSVLAVTGFINAILLIIMLISVIKSYSTIVFCQVAILIIFSVEFLFARNIMRRITEQE